MASESQQGAPGSTPYDWSQGGPGRLVFVYALGQALVSGMVWLQYGRGNPLLEVSASLALGLGFVVLERAHSRPAWGYIIMSSITALLAVPLLRGLAAPAETWLGGAPVLEVLAAALVVAWVCVLVAMRHRLDRRAMDPTTPPLVDLDAGECYYHRAPGSTTRQGDKPQGRRPSILVYLLPLGPALGLLLYRAGLGSIVLPVGVMALCIGIAAASAGFAALAIRVSQIERENGVKLRFYWAPPVSKRQRVIP